MYKIRFTGRRKASSYKEGYPWRGITAAWKFDGDRWKYKIINFIYNYPPSLNIFIHFMHRHLIDEERGVLERHM